ncbi:unnamed protein product [Candida verbasci]|uniref:Glucosidase 2 subunit beta n=1 Tax=Candida verbasci TaxID=1227364 RepID=A0A9W4X886_9ASCO|nr:unnamed protein product [Candida verbasci]
MLLLFLLTTVLSDIIGVSPEDQHLYQPEIINGEKKWHCLNDSSIILNVNQINDDICDCPDGSDEPGTNACPVTPFKFYCKNEGFIPGYIDQFKLNDGVCDYEICCDGSDEYKFENCENKCQEINRQYQEYKEETQKFVKEALKKKDSIINQAKSKRTQLINLWNKLEKSLPMKKMEINNLKLEAESNQQHDLTVFDLLGDKIVNLIERIENHKKSTIKQQNSIQALEKILDRLSKEYNPNFNDLAVKDSIHKFQHYVSNKEEEVSEDIHETNQVLHDLVEKAKELTHSGDSTEPTFGNMFHHYFKTIIGTFLTKPKDSVEPKSSTDLSPKIGALEKELAEYEKRIDDIKNNLNMNFGPDDILRAFDSLRITKKLGGYHYIINILGSIVQDDILIGNFKEYKDGKLYYNKGARCWNGPQRSAEVEFQCGKGPELISVSEPEKCHYYFIIKSEAWCNEITDEEITENFKINYDLL